MTQAFVGRDGGLCHTCPRPHHGVRYDVPPDAECEDCGLKMHTDAMAMATDLGQRGCELGDPCPACDPSGKRDGPRMVSTAIRLAEKLGRFVVAEQLRAAHVVARKEKGANHAGGSPPGGNLEGGP